MPHDETGLAADSDGEHFVYLYRTPAGIPKYVGYGKTVDRATAHAEVSHNSGLRSWLASGQFDLTVAGPYGDRREALHVEAALISALSPEFNKSPGEGPGFVPLGVPPELGNRPSMAPLTVPQVGKIAGGALIVYSLQDLSSGTVAPNTTPQILTTKWFWRTWSRLGRSDH